MEDEVGLKGARTGLGDWRNSMGWRNTLRREGLEIAVQKMNEEGRDYRGKEGMQKI